MSSKLSQQDQQHLSALKVLLEEHPAAKLNGLKAAMDYLHEHRADYHWVGIYKLDGDTLVLGPYNGLRPTICGSPSAAASAAPQSPRTPTRLSPTSARWWQLPRMQPRDPQRNRRPRPRAGGRTSSGKCIRCRRHTRQPVRPGRRSLPDGSRQAARAASPA